MKSREEYIDKLAAQLKEWSAKIDELESKARAAKADAKTGYCPNDQFMIARI